MIWRNLTVVLGLLCFGLLYRDCTRPSVRPAPSPAACAEPAPRIVPRASGDDSRASSGDPDESRAPHHASSGDAAGHDGAPHWNGIRLPAWTAFLAPHPGEDLKSYKDRMLPLAQAAVAPQRARVAAARDQLVAAAHLDPTQRAALDMASQAAATEIEDKLLNSVLAGDFNPSTFKPMTAISTARDVLDSIDRANTQFTQTLSDDQRSALAKQPFDFADYLLFSTRWEDALPF